MFRWDIVSPNKAVRFGERLASRKTHVVVDAFTSVKSVHSAASRVEMVMLSKTDAAEDAMLSMMPWRMILHVLSLP